MTELKKRFNWLDLTDSEEEGEQSPKVETLVPEDPIETLDSNIKSLIKTKLTRSNRTNCYKDCYTNFLGSFAQISFLQYKSFCL